MKVLCVIDDLGSGGAQRQLVNMAVGLVARGHQVECFTYQPDAYFQPVLDKAGIRVHRHQKPGRFSFAPVKRLRQHISEHHTDAVLAFLETPSVYAELATTGLTGVRLVVGERSGVARDARSIGLVRRLKSQLHRRADAVVSNSHARTAWLRTHFPYLDRKLATVWNGVTLSDFPERPRCDNSAGETRALRLVGIGRVAPAKNIPRLIEAIARARALGTDIEVCWVGRVDDTTEAARCHDSLEATGLGGAWTWLGEQRDVVTTLHQADALIAPSLAEGLPNVICEALATGTPVIASDVADNATLVGEGCRGMLCDASSVDSITAAVLAFAALSPMERASMGARGRQFAETRLTYEVCVDAYEALLEGRQP